MIEPDTRDLLARHRRSDSALVQLRASPRTGPTIRFDSRGEVAMDGKESIMSIGRPTLALVIGAALLSTSASAAVRSEPRPAANDLRAPAGRGVVTLSEATSRVDPSATRLGDVIPLLRDDAAAALAAIDWS